AAEGQLDRLTLGLLLLCAAVYYATLLFRGTDDLDVGSLRTSYDFHTYFRPRFWLASEELRAGRLPLWNRYEWGGIPLLATSQPAAFYPPRVLLYAVLPPLAAHFAFVVGHHLAILVGFRAFLRGEGLRGISLFVGPAVIGFGTLLLNSAYHPIRIACLSYMPVILLLARRVAEGGGPGAFGLLGLAVGFQLLAGYPEFTLDVALLYVVQTTTAWLVGHVKSPPWLALPRVGAAFVLGGAVAAAQLLPLAELAHVSGRVALAGTATRLPDLVALEPVPILIVPGLVVFAAIGLGLRAARAATAGFLLCYFVSAGGWRLLHHVPGFSMVRFPLTWVLLSPFHFGWVAAVGAAALATGSQIGARGRRVALWAAVVSAAALAAAWLLATFASTYATQLAPGLPFVIGEGAPLSETATRWWAEVHANNVSWAPSLALALVGAALLARLSLRAQRGLPTTERGFVVASTTFALAHVAATPFGGTPSPFEPPEPHGAVHRLHRDPGTIKGRAISPQDLLWGYEITDRIPSALGVEISFLPARARAVLDHFGFLPTFGKIQIPRLLRARGFLDMMDVEVVVMHRTFTPALAATGLDLLATDGDDMLASNPARMGPAWVNYAVQRPKGADRVRDYVLGARFSPSREVVLEAPTRNEYPSQTPHPVTHPTRVVRRGPADAEFEVELPRPGILVVSESAYPGWEATVDDVPTPWFPANYLLRGVELEAGRHVVRFRYEPPSVLAGLWLSAAGIAGVLALLVWGHRRGRRAAV
ncbi:MAG: hypothetical protein FJ104_07405, partial [Deltaproteobacteria bacterium]|nr:hypothetical protein [Deltaproteobacteria bacterium]